MAMDIQSAARGNRAAMEQIYSSNKQSIWQLASSLLKDPAKAQSAVAWVFKNAWSGIEENHISTDEELSSFLARRTVAYCRKTASKQEPKAFQISALAGRTAAANWDDLSTLERFCVTLENSGMTPERIAAVVKLDQSTVKQVLSRIKNIAPPKAGSLPQETDGAVKEAIAAYAEPFEKQAKKKKKKTIIGAAAALAAVVIAVGVFFIVKAVSPTYEIDGHDFTKFVNEASYYADIEIENYGTITVALDDKAAPITVKNFVDLAESGFYDGLTFHRIMKGFMMQGGDPEGTGFGGAETTIYGEFAENGFDNPIPHNRGVISMARRGGDNNSANSQFFIVHEDSNFLDGSYAAFGVVTDGMKVVDKVCEDARPTDDNGSIAPEDQPVIKTITIRKK